jgi:hypothetical protein
VRSLYSFIIKPKNKRYENTKKVGDSELILNTEMQNHEYVSRIGVVIETPINGKTGIKKGDEVILHHNVFRRFYDVRGEEKNSMSYFNEEEYFVDSEQIYMYKRNGKWKPVDGYCFVKPLVNRDEFNTSSRIDLKGVIKYIDNGLKKNGIKFNDIVGFTPDSEYTFIVDGEMLYRVPTNSICIKYGHKGDEDEYNTSWLQGG